MPAQLLIRTLHWPAEREAWLDHVEACFSPKGTTRAYFAAHLDHSADCAAGGPGPIILVAVDGAAIASTLRVFRLTLRFGGAEHRCGGIGEVCTAAAYRRRGLAGRLLEQARLPTTDALKTRDGCSQ